MQLAAAKRSRVSASPVLHREYGRHSLAQRGRRSRPERVAERDGGDAVVKEADYASGCPETNGQWHRNRGGSQQGGGWSSRRLRPRLLELRFSEFGRILGCKNHLADC